MPRLVLVATSRRVSVDGARRIVSPTARRPAAANAGPIGHGAGREVLEARVGEAGARRDVAGLLDADLEEAGQLRRPGDLDAASAASRRPLEHVVDERCAASTPVAALQRAPARDGVHLDDAVPAVVARQDVDAGVLGAHRPAPRACSGRRAARPAPAARPWRPARRWSSTPVPRRSMAPMTRSPTTKARMSSQPCGTNSCRQ